MKIIIMILGVTLFVGSGCETLSGRQKRQREVRLNNDIVNLKESVEQLEQRVKGVEAGREDVYARILDSQTRREKEAKRYDAEIEDLNSRLAAAEKDQALREKEMVANLSKTMAGIIKKNDAAGGVVSGVVHPVEAGETLSEIAAAYGVKTSAIIKANRMKNPDDLKIGQRLFIPD